MHVRDFVLANKDEMICARGVNELKIGCFAHQRAQVNEMKRKAEWILRVGVREVREWNMNHLCCPCFNSKVVLELNKLHKGRKTYNTLPPGKPLGSDEGRRPSLCAGQSTTHNTT